MKNAEGEEIKLHHSKFLVRHSIFTQFNGFGYLFAENDLHFNLRLLAVRFCPSPKVIAVILMFTNLLWPALFRLRNLMGLELLDTDSSTCLKTWRNALL